MCDLLCLFVCLIFSGAFLWFNEKGRLMRDHSKYYSGKVCLHCYIQMLVLPLVDTAEESVHVKVCKELFIEVYTVQTEAVRYMMSG